MREFYRRSAAVNSGAEVRGRDNLACPRANVWSSHLDERRGARRNHCRFRSCGQEVKRGNVAKAGASNYETPSGSSLQ